MIEFKRVLFQKSSVQIGSTAASYVEAAVLIHVARSRRSDQSPIPKWLVFLIKYLLRPLRPFVDDFFLLFVILQVAREEVLTTSEIWTLHTIPDRNRFVQKTKKSKSFSNLQKFDSIDIFYLFSIQNDHL